MNGSVPDILPSIHMWFSLHPFPCLLRVLGSRGARSSTAGVRALSPSQRRAVSLESSFPGALIQVWRVKEQGEMLSGSDRAKSLWGNVQDNEGEGSSRPSATCSSPPKNKWHSLKWRVGPQERQEQPLEPVNPETSCLLCVPSPPGLSPNSKF